MKITGVLLSAGLGTRLKPITDSVPKCLVEVNGKPLIDHWIEKFELVDCGKLIVNTHHLSSKVIKYLENHKTHLDIDIRHEEQLLGTAGTVISLKKEIENNMVILAHGDNMTNLDLEGIVNAYRNRPRESILTMLTFRTDRPEMCGIVKTDADGIVRGFYEKVHDAPGFIANGALYVFGKECLELMDQLNAGCKLFDFSLDVIPNMIGKINTFHTTDKFIDIGTPETLAQARLIWSNNNGEKDAE